MYCVTKININRTAVGKENATAIMNALVLELTDMVDSFTCYPTWYSIVVQDSKKGFVAIQFELEQRGLKTDYIKIESLDYDFMNEDEKEGRG